MGCSQSVCESVRPGDEPQAGFLLPSSETLPPGNRTRTIGSLGMEVRNEKKEVGVLTRCVSILGGSSKPN